MSTHELPQRGDLFLRSSGGTFGTDARRPSHAASDSSPHIAQLHSASTPHVVRRFECDYADAVSPQVSDKDKDDPQLRDVLSQRPEVGSWGRRKRVSHSRH